MYIISKIYKSGQSNVIIIKNLKKRGSNMDIKKIISEMTLEEKALLVSGKDMWTTDAIERVGIPSIFMSDGPHGLRKQENNQNTDAEIYDSIDAVCFPTACATTASFDRELMYRMGVDLGKECQAVDVSTILGPAINIKSFPLHILTEFSLRMWEPH